MGGTWASAIVCCGLLLGGTALTPVPRVLVPAATAAGAASSEVTPCSSGLVALTFDDGPGPTVTPLFLDLLRDRRVPATFFVVGQRVRAKPSMTRRISQLGFTIGNHTYRHEDLRRLSGAAVKQTLWGTQQAIRDAGARPTRLMRPPYGSIDDRVRSLVGEAGLVPVMWTTDPRDWDGRSASAIARSVLAGLKPREPNIVVLHDGVATSLRTLRALPRIITGTRSRGYCFADLDDRGRPTPPVPVGRVSDAAVNERPGGTTVRLTVTLDRPTSRRTSVRVRTIGQGATSGKDFVAVDERVAFPVGSRRRVVSVRVKDDPRDERDERFALRLSAPRGLRIGDGIGAAVIRDDDPPPRVSVKGAEVTEPGTGKVEVPVVLRLSGPSERWIRLKVATQSVTAGLDDFVSRTGYIELAPGRVSADFTVIVVADELVEDVESFEVRVVEGSNAVVDGSVGVVRILPPTPTPTPTPTPAPPPENEG
ncbi:MAG TPA: polysaccharide deacetylase family protein [Nocardioidaceae bacterium]|nr:polysaccharide deacetylase family protein [Nocardioidaceae bacterium]